MIHHKRQSIFAALASILLLSSPLHAQRNQDPIRNTFTTAAETVIDAAVALDITAEPAVYDPQFQQLKTKKDVLTGMVEGDSEQDVATAMNDILYTLSACRLQAINGAEIAPCKVRLTHAVTRAMTALHKHKSAGVWVDGSPA